MAEKNKVTVRIAGNEYIICGSETPEYIQKVALFVDRKLQEIMKRNHLLSTSMASVLASVNMADELLRINDAHGKTEYELTELQKKHQELKEEMKHLKADNVRLSEKYNLLQIELTKRETELNEARKRINGE